MTWAEENNTYYCYLSTRFDLSQTKKEAEAFKRSNRRPSVLAKFQQQQVAFNEEKIVKKLKQWKSIFA